MKWDGVDQNSLIINNILAVPLIVQDEPIGVLEVFNKENELPFTNADAEILEGFRSSGSHRFEQRQ